VPQYWKCACVDVLDGKMAPLIHAPLASSRRKGANQKNNGSKAVRLGAGRKIMEFELDPTDGEAFGGDEEEILYYGESPGTHTDGDVQSMGDGAEEATGADDEEEVVDDGLSRSLTDEELLAPGDGFDEEAWLGGDMSAF
jgi:hypothetical protein